MYDLFNYIIIENKSGDRMLNSKISVNMIAAGLVALVLTAACTPSKPPQQFTLRIGLFPVLDTLPYYVMKEQGFAKKNGIQFVEITYPGGAAVIEAMAAGKVDVGISIGSVPVLSAAERGMIPDTIIPVAANDFADPEHPGMAVLASKSVTGWRELAGQQIAVNAKNSITAAALIGRLKLEGVHNYTIVEIDFPNMGLAVAGGNIVAAGLMEPYLTQSLLRGDGKLLGWIIGGSPFEQFEYTMVVFSADFYRSQPQAVRAFLRAYLQALQWTNQNPDESRLILARALNLSPEVTQKMKLLRFSPDGRNDPTLLTGMQSLLIDIGMLKKRIPANKLYDETLLNEVHAEKR
jgi:NitT/TauT family transport system substrate-binding protein